MKATDTDQGANGMVRFKLGSSNGDHLNFSINSVTGVLTNLSPMDREKQSVYKFTVYAFDMGETSLTSSVAIHVYIVDIDDHPPTFSSDKKTQDLVVPENAAFDTPLSDGSKGKFVGQISGAFDKDTGNNSQICYFIVSSKFINVMMYMYVKFYVAKHISVMAMYNDCWSSRIAAK